MLDFFKKLFGWKTVVVIVDPLKVGEVWQAYSVNPFDIVTSVEIKDLRAGWVQYHTMGATINAVEEDTFRKCYPVKVS